MNNKGRRQELTKLKFKRRLKQMGLNKKEGNFYCFKTTGKPCSCKLCSPYKYSRKIKYKSNDTERY